MNFAKVFHAVTFVLLAHSIAHGQSDRQLHRLSLQNAEELRHLFRYDGERLPILSAHRGGAVDNYPENCLATFEHTLEHTFSLLEIDLRTTSDDVIVLHHDSTLDRTTTGKGPVNERTWEEIQQLRLKSKQGDSTEYQIPTLDAAIEWARGKTVLILDKKEVPVEVCVEKIRQHNAQSFVMIMASGIRDIQKCHQLDPDIMMEVMIGNEQRFESFGSSNVPWNRIIAFVGHEPPADKLLLQQLHSEGVFCMAGTSRNLDLKLRNTNDPGRDQLRMPYQAVLDFGIDIIETDLPVGVSSLLFHSLRIPPDKAEYFRFPSK